MTLIGQLFGREPELRTFTHSPAIVDNSCFVGIEVEVENLREPPGVDLWICKRDGSLRNHGVEYVLRDPLNGADLVKAITDLYSALPAEADFSDRCGLHVHIDVRKLDGRQFLSYVYHTLFVERTLYKYCGAGRDGNIFCIPYYKAPASLGHLSSLTHSNISRNLPLLVSNAQKYAGINLAAVGNYGSVEFRMHNGTDLAARVLEWVNILLALRKYAVEHSDIAEAFLATVSATGPKEFAESIFSEAPAILEFLDKRDLYDGIRTVQEYIEAQNLGKAAAKLPKKHTDRSLAIKFLKLRKVEITNQPVVEDNAEEYKLPEAGDFWRAAEDAGRVADVQRMRPQRLRPQQEQVVAQPPWRAHVIDYFEEIVPPVHVVATADDIPRLPGHGARLYAEVDVEAARRQGGHYLVVDRIRHGDNIYNVQRGVVSAARVVELFF